MSIFVSKKLWQLLAYHENLYWALTAENRLVQYTMFILSPTSSTFCWYLTLAFKGLVAPTRVVTDTHRHTQTHSDYQNLTPHGRSYLLPAYRFSHYHKIWKQRRVHVSVKPLVQYNVCNQCSVQQLICVYLWTCWWMEYQVTESCSSQIDSRVNMLRWRCESKGGKLSAVPRLYTWAAQLHNLHICNHPAHVNTNTCGSWERAPTT